jgi:hypothetical protein
MARVRTVRVGEKRYLQVVENTAGGSIDVLQSFGDYTMENWLRANQFANSYNQLRDLTTQPRPTGNPDDFFRAALAIFGVILGATIVASLLGED